MLKFIGKRILMLIPVLLGVSLIVFILMQLTPGDPAQIILGAQAAPEDIANLRQEMGLNDPLPLQFGRFLLGIVTLDFGTSLKDGLPVLDKLMEALPYTAQLTFAAILIAVLIGIPVGIISATRQYSIFDRCATVFALVGFSTPNFWLSIMLILVFSVTLRWLPVSGSGSLLHLVLPAIALGTQSAAIITRMTRSSMLEVMNQDYIRTARAKGLREKVVIYSHAWRNALLPVITQIISWFLKVFAGSVVVENTFSFNGMGALNVYALNSLDYELAMAIQLFFTMVSLLGLLLCDLAYGIVDPRVRVNK